MVVAGPPAAASFDRPISALEDHEYMQRSTTDRASKEHSQPQSCMNVTEMLRMPHAPVQHRPQSRVQHSQMPSHAFPHSLQHATARPPPSVSPYVLEHAMLSHETMTQHVPCPIGQNSFMRHHGHPHIQGHATACPPSSEPLYAPQPEMFAEATMMPSHGLLVPSTMSGNLPPVNHVAVETPYRLPPIPVPAKQIADNFVPTFHTKAKFGSWRKTYDNCRLHNAQVYTTIYFANAGAST